MRSAIPVTAPGRYPPVDPARADALAPAWPSMPPWSRPATASLAPALHRESDTGTIRTPSRSARPPRPVRN